MSLDVVVYIELHHPLRLKLPAQLVPRGATLEDIRRCLFDESADRSVLCFNQQLYSDLFKTLNELLDRGFKLSISVSSAFLRYIASASENISYTQDAKRRLTNLSYFPLPPSHFPLPLGGLIAHPNVEIVGIEPYCSLSFYLDIEMFCKQTQLWRKQLEELFGKNITTAATTELCMNHEIYKSFANLKFNSAIMEGAEWVLQGRKPSYLCKMIEHPLLCLRHKPLSVLTMKTISTVSRDIPQQVRAIAQQVKATSGDLVLLGWNIDELVKNQPCLRRVLRSGQVAQKAESESTQTSSFLYQLFDELNSLDICFSTVSEVAAKFSGKARKLTLPAFTSTRIDGGMEHLLNSETQQWIFELMHHAYNMAKLSKNEDLMDIALCLAQIDNLRFTTLLSSGLKPDWYKLPYRGWNLSPNELLGEVGRVYRNFIKAARYYI